MYLRHRPRTARALALATTAVCVWGTASASASAPIRVLPPPPPSCAAIQPHSLSPEAWPALKREVLPRGAAVIRLCRYGSTSSPRLRLRYARLIRSQSTVRHLENQIDTLPQIPTTAEVSTCPFDNGASVWVYASYFRRHHATVMLSLTGCREALNGYLGASASEGPGQDPSHLGPRLIEELEQLTGCAPIRTCERPSSV